VVDADSGDEQEQPVDAIEGRCVGAHVIQVADHLAGLVRQAVGASWIADEDAELGFFGREFAYEFATDVSGGSGDKYHRNSIISRLMITIDG
jgi:hypothetical protein